MKKEIDCYEITANIIIRKDYWEESKKQLKELANLIQSGIEVPCESIKVETKG